jgi:hypothetical protein
MCEKGPIAGMLGVDDNFCDFPQLCNTPLEFTLCHSSSCAPDNSPGTCGLLGAWPVGCVCTTAVGEGTAAASWGVIKSFYK